MLMHPLQTGGLRYAHASPTAAIGANLILTSVILVIGLSCLKLSIGNVELSGMVLASVVAVLLSLIFNICRKLKILED